MSGDQANNYLTSVCTVCMMMVSVMINAGICGKHIMLHGIWCSSVHVFVCGNQCGDSLQS